MSWDSVPWFIGGGAQHSPEVARLLAFAATSGAEGIVTPGDLKVQALAVPGGSVRVAPGAGLIRNRATGGDSQTYVARNPIEDVVAIAATGSGAGRSDLIVAQIEDPFMAGEPWQDPADPTVGPYIFTRVIPNVPAGTTRLQDVAGFSGRSAITLARVDIPASTATVTAAMVKDLRTLALPRQWRETATFAGMASQALTSTADFVKFPAEAAAQVTVPAWATHVQVTANLFQVAQADATDTDGWIRAAFGTLVGPQLAFDFNATTGWGAQRFSMAAALTADVTALRGQKISATIQGKRNSITPGKMQVDGASQVLFDIQFQEKAV